MGGQVYINFLITKWHGDVNSNIKKKNELCCQLFIGDKKLRCIDLYLLSSNKYKCVCDYTLGQLFFDENFDINVLKNISYNNNIDEKIEEIVEKSNFSKYFKFLPKELKKEIYIERFCDFDGLNEFINNIEFISYKE